MPLNQTSYDELPYTCNAMPYAQPDRLATVATLFGMTPPPVQNCRVLELGCCDGSNIIATAHSLPKAECWGVDLSAQHIVNGRALIKTLGLQNITLKQMNILEIDESFGIFDYIIAHGIYSWVSSAEQEKILSICKHHLAANGVAYVSYNTKPGWNMRSTLRDMMLYHSALRPNQLKNLLQFFTDATAEGKDTYSRFTNELLNQLSQLPESFLFKEFIEEENEPLYFHQFLKRAHGLEYLGDAFVQTMVIEDDLIHQEQLMDFIRNRHFRHTLLCHQGTPLNRTLSPDLLHHFYTQNVQIFGFHSRQK